MQEEKQVSRQVTPNIWNNNFMSDDENEWKQSWRIAKKFVIFMTL